MGEDGTEVMTDAGDPRETPVRLRRLASRLLAMASGQADRIVGAGLTDVGARKWHYAVLSSLQEFGPASQATLSRRTGIYRSDMVGVLNELAERGLVERAPDPADRRRNVITLTEQGSLRLNELGDLLAELEDRLLEPFDPAERGTLLALLTRLVDHHREQAPPAS